MRGVATKNLYSHMKSPGAQGESSFDISMQPSSEFQDFEVESIDDSKWKLTRYFWIDRREFTNYATKTKTFENSIQNSQKGLLQDDSGVRYYSP